MTIDQRPQWQKATCHCRLNGRTFQDEQIKHADNAFECASTQIEG
jgi:hypothetical protein